MTVANELVMTKDTEHAMQLLVALAAVRACPGITVERLSAILLCDVPTAYETLVYLDDAGAVEEIQDECGVWYWHPEAWCHVCGCTTEAGCEGGCGWEVGPGEVAAYGELAGICTRCA